VSKPKVIAIVGPTSSGKSALGILIAKKLAVYPESYRGEVISADSRQVYRGLDIGTGKVTKKEMAGVPHHLLGVANPKRQFSADDFVRLGERAISNILQKTRIPIVVGGTGFYVDALLGRFNLPNVAPNQKLREQLEQRTTTQLFKQLQKLDSARAQTIEPEHKRRLIRAIEIAKAVGKSPSKSQITNPTNNKYEVLWLGINPPKTTLKKRIHTRLLARLKAGMVREAQKLHAAGLTYKRMEELGLEYRSLARFLQGTISRLALELELERAINHYAKRQLRWFKRNSDIVWIKNSADALRRAKKFVNAK
jgi:tRNA dimethylallyltransferase